MLETISSAFLHGIRPGTPEAPDAQTRDLWRRRYFAALRRLRQAGIQTIADEQAGAETYVALRNRWNGYIRGIAPMLAYTAEEIDPAGIHPESSNERVEFRARLHSAGTT